MFAHYQEIESLIWIPVIPQAIHCPMVQDNITVWEEDGGGKMASHTILSKKLQISFVCVLEELFVLGLSPLRLGMW